LSGFSQKFFAELNNSRGHGGGEEGNLAIRGQAFKDDTDAIEKSLA